MYTYAHDVASCGWHAFFLYLLVCHGRHHFMLQHTPANQFLKCVASQCSKSRKPNGIPSLGGPLLTKTLACSRRTVDDIVSLSCECLRMATLAFKCNSSQPAPSATSNKCSSMIFLPERKNESSMCLWMSLLIISKSSSQSNNFWWRSCHQHDLS